MSNKVYKIVERHRFFKHVKKVNEFIEKASFDVLSPNFDTLEKAQAYIEESTSNAERYNPNGVVYEKLTKNTFKLTYTTSKNYRILEYKICEFENF